VRAVVADARTEVMADRAGCGLLRVGSAHRIAPLDDGAFSFQHHSENLARRHEVREFAEEWPRFVDRVEAACFFLGQAHRLDGHDVESGLVNARENFALLIAADRVRLDNCESTFDGQNTSSDWNLWSEDEESFLAALGMTIPG